MTWTNPLTWPIEPLLLLGIELAAILYLRGGRQRAHVPDRWRTLAFWSGLAVIVVALDTPLESLARQLFWAHMTQHLLLITVAAPLLVAGAPWMQMWRGLPLALRRPVARAVVKAPSLSAVRRLFHWATTPIGAFVLSTGALWFWHWPAAYDLTLRNHTVHHLEHAIFLGFGILFWAQVIDQRPFKARLSNFQRAVYVFLGTIQSWALAAVLSFATAPFYAYASLRGRPGGISALTDQVLGGGIMWVPGSITYSTVFIVCLALWFRDEDRKAAAFSQPRAGMVVK